MKKRMAIVFNSDFRYWPSGGTLSYVLSIIPGLSRQFDLDLWGCSVDGRVNRELIIEDDSFTINICSKAKRKKLIPNAARCFFYTFMNASRIEKEKYDVIYFHLSVSELAFLSRIRHSKSLILIHQHGMAYPGRIANRLQYISHKKADCVFFTTDQESFLRHKKEIQRDNVYWMPSMIDLSQFRQDGDPEKTLECIDSKAVTFVFSGRITAWKNPLLLLDAFEICTKRDPERDFKLVYLGDGDEYKKLEAEIKQKKLDGKVTLKGWISHTQVLDELSQCDVFVLPSRGEGVSVSALEAMAAGLPVAGLNVEGMKGFIINGKNGYLAEETAEDLADAMLKTAGLSREGIEEEIQKYDTEKVMREMLELINRSLKGKNKKYEKIEHL